MNEYTFGKTPAAMYLARTLIEIGDEALSRKVGKRIHATQETVNQLLFAYDHGTLTPKTLGNMLRLLREEVTNEESAQFYESKSPAALVDMLRKNVQIGSIKKAIRTATVARKIEHVMSAPLRKGMNHGIHTYADGLLRSFSYFDNGLNQQIVAGQVFENEINKEVTTYVNRPHADEIDGGTAALLHERSLKRCTRQGKPHTVAV